jgi:hypothetical protein
MDTIITPEIIYDSDESHDTINNNVDSDFEKVQNFTSDFEVYNFYKDIKYRKIFTYLKLTFYL